MEIKIKIVNKILIFNVLLIFKFFHFFCLSKRNETKKKTLFRRNFSAQAENRLANSASLRLLGAPEFQSFAQTILAEKGLKTRFSFKTFY